MYHVLLDNKTKLKSSQHLFAVQMAKQCYITSENIASERMQIVDDEGKQYPDFANWTSMKKEVEGYIARYDDDILFSNKPMKKEGFFGDGNVWYDALKTEEESPLDLRVDMHNYLDIPELTFENSPRRCKLTIEIGEQLPGNDQHEIDRRVKAMRIRGNIRELAHATGRSYDEAVEILRKSIPNIDEYLKEEW